MRWRQKIFVLSAKPSWECWVNPVDDEVKGRIQDLKGEASKTFAVLGMSLLMFQMSRQDEKIKDLENPLGIPGQDRFRG